MRCLDVRKSVDASSQTSDARKISARVQRRCLLENVFTRAFEFMINKREKINRWSIVCALQVPPDERSFWSIVGENWIYTFSIA